MASAHEFTVQSDNTLKQFFLSVGSNISCHDCPLHVLYMIYQLVGVSVVQWLGHWNNLFVFSSFHFKIKTVMRHVLLVIIITILIILSIIWLTGFACCDWSIPGP